MKNNWKPFGNNILIAPESKNKIIGDTSKYFLYGKVLAVGDKVFSGIEVGDTIGYTLWGLNKLEKDGEEFFFLQDNPDFVLGLIKHDNQA